VHLLGLRSTHSFQVNNPATGELIAKVPFMGKKDAQKAITAASAAFLREYCLKLPYIQGLSADYLCIPVRGIGLSFQRCYRFRSAFTSFCGDFLVLIINVCIPQKPPSAVPYRSLE